MNFASILAMEIAKQRSACRINGKDCYNQNIINHGVNIMAAGGDGRQRQRKDSKDTNEKTKRK